jgi:two-component system sensor histidine kinase KdpD
MRDLSRASELAGALAGLTGVSLIVVLLRLPSAAPTPVIAALVLLLAVLGAATISTLRAAAVTSLAATLAFNFFFLPPLHAFTIADPQNWVALFAFLVVATIASHLSTAARQRAIEADARRQEVTRLFDLSRDILLTNESEGAIATLARHVARRFQLASVAVCLPDTGGWQVHQGAEETVEVTSAQLDDAFARLHGTLEYDARERTYGGHAVVPRTGSGTVFTLVPLRLGSRPVGLLATDGSGLDKGTLDALGGVIAIAIERVHFLEDRKVAEALKQRADLASALLASFSHDLRTPLTTVRVAVANLRSLEIPEAERVSQADIALKEIDRLNRLFQDILDMARIDAEAIEAERQWVAPADIVDAAIAQLGPVLDGRALNVDADAGVQVHVDPRLTSSALAHLLENAAHYSPAETPIDIRGWSDADGLHLVVRDHGAGLDAAELDHLFERFHRGPAARTHAGGTGMGLAISRGLLAAQAGRIWGENVSDGGARFTIAVPAPVRALVSRET